MHKNIVITLAVGYRFLEKSNNNQRRMFQAIPNLFKEISIFLITINTITQIKRKEKILLAIFHQ
ncbi:hypothetical protein DWY20_05880 [Phocaeicola coprocola]|uniref:Uncharacterized protein n=2 Tax=Phocaeicola coprocola TaxID=310298 RepID=B3JFS4_9BACT|nr:hypothetical protein BACCOP_00725 [Phocaeicola coprocola DSM 17136]RGR97774.1 hypothetical protein DWY20_05880 [Phocaeicola coprocola]